MVIPPSAFNVENSTLVIEIADRQSDQVIDLAELQSLLSMVLKAEGVCAAELSVALVSDAEIHTINRDFLNHDFPTDVISFSNSPIPQGRPQVSWPAETVLDGELVISVDTARRIAERHGWSARRELILYAVHGLLHLVGYDDLTESARPLMRQREREMLILIDPGGSADRDRLLETLEQ